MHPLISHHIPNSAQILMSVGLIRSGCSAATNLEVHKGDRDLFDYCTFGMETANYAQTVWVNTAFGIDHSRKNLSKLTRKVVSRSM